MVSRVVADWWLCAFGFVFMVRTLELGAILLEFIPKDELQQTLFKLATAPVGNAMTIILLLHLQLDRFRIITLVSPDAIQHCIHLVFSARCSQT